MRLVVQFLLYASRVLAICAVLAGLGAGFLWASAAGLVCVDQCSSPDFYASYFAPSSINIMTPCVVIAALAAVVFLVYCLATRQVRRAVIVLIVLLFGGLVGVVALVALARHALAMLPEEMTEANYYTYMHQLEALYTEWGLALMLVSGAWSGVLAFLQWKR